MHPISSEAILIPILLNVILGLLALTWKPNALRAGRWVSTFGLLVLFGTLLFCWMTAKDATDPLVFVRGWIWPKAENTSIQVGLFQDSIGLAVSFFHAAIALVGLWGMDAWVSERGERRCSAALLTASGLALTWTAYTPWLSMIGIGICVMGGFLGLGASWGSEAGSRVASRFAWERSAALLLAVIGGAALTGTGAQLHWGASEALQLNALQSASAAVMLFGLLLMLQPFPMLGWTTWAGQTSGVSHLLFAQYFSGAAALGVMLRLLPQLKDSWSLTAVGWYALVSVVASGWVGVFQRRWRTGLSAWLSSSFALCAAVLSFSTQIAGALYLVSIGAMVGALAAIGSGEELAAKNGAPSKDLSGLKKATIFGAALLGSGLIGSSMASGSLIWLSSLFEDTAVLVLAGCGLVLTFFLAGRSALMLAQRTALSHRGWVSFLLPIALLLGSLGLFWTGSVTGGLLGGQVDLVLSAPLLHGGFGGPAKKELPVAPTSFWVLLTCLAIGWALALWSVSSKADKLSGLHERFPRFSAFVSEAFQLERALAAIWRSVFWGVALLQSVLESRLWSRWLPIASYQSISRSARFLVQADTHVTRALDRGVAGSVETPSKLLQLIQSGNVQWYLIFAVGSGLAMLLHFLRFP